MKKILGLFVIKGILLLSVITYAQTWSAIKQLTYTGGGGWHLSPCVQVDLLYVALWSKARLSRRAFDGFPGQRLVTGLADTLRT